MSDNKMVIEILPQSIQLIQIRDGVRSVKQTNLQSIQEVLTKDKTMQTPLLPSQWGTQFYARNNDRELYVITTPPHIRDVKYDNHGDREPGEEREIQEYRVPMPGLCWFLIIKNIPGSQQRSYYHGMVYAIKQQIISTRDRLYRYPFANVDHRWMCWGDTYAPEIGSSKGVMMIPDHFLSMNFNHHLDDNKFNSFEVELAGHKVSLFRTIHLFKWMDQELKKDPEFTFPYQCLKPECTLQEAIDHHIREFLR